MKQSNVISLFLVAALMAPCAMGQAAHAGIDAGVSQADAVFLNVVVHDKKNRPVVDLKPEELTVTDDGSPVALSSLRLVSGTGQSEPLITLVFDRPGSENGLGPQFGPAMMKDARDAATKILKMTAQSGFAFSVLSVERRLRLRHGFTTDRNALVEAIRVATEPEKAGSDSTASDTEKDLISVALTGAFASGKRATVDERIQAQALYAALKSSSSIVQDQHIRPSLAGLLTLTQSEQEIPQRKAILYFSSLQDKQIDSHARAAIESIAATANQAGVAIYVVDMNATNANGADMVTTSAVASDASGYTGSPEGYGLARRATDISVQKADGGDLAHLAEQTGGSYISADGLFKSVEQLIGDMSTYYEASYLPSIKEYDGRFRSIVVKPLRTGLKIRTQTGYLALPPRAEDGSRPQAYELPLFRILKQTPLPTELAFRAEVLTIGNHSSAGASTLAIEVPLASLETQKDSNTPTNTAHFSMIANIRDRAGAVVAHFSSDTPQRVTVGNPESKPVEVISLQRPFAVPAGLYVAEVVILDCNSGKAGAQRISFEIPKEADTPSLSKIVLVRQMDPFRDGEDMDESLRHGTVRITPNLSGTLSPGVTNVPVFFATHTDPHSMDKASLSIQVLRDGKPLGDAPINSEQANGTEYSSYLNSFTIDPPQDGTYQVKVTLRQGGKTAEADVSFSLSDEEPPGSDAGLSTPGETSRPVGPLKITFPTNPIQPPGAEALNSILADATKFAADYRNSLPNFICEQVTDRFVSVDGAKTWKHQDKVIGQLTYLDYAENWSFLENERDGHKNHTNDADNERGISTAGIFGAVITGLFRPSSKAEITWKETGVLNNGTVQVFDFRVAQANSNLNLRVSATDVITVGYHGLVYIDGITHGIRRITEIADGVPKKYPIHATSVSADYDYVSIGGRDYLLPVGARIILKKGRNDTALNEIGFRDFHRFGSTARIVAAPPENAQ